MAKITIIGAGSVVFTRQLTSDILSYPELQDSVISLMDIDAERLARAHRLVQRMIAERRLPAKVEASLDRRQALAGAKYVITTVQVGGLEAFRQQVEIPRKYGVSQCVGDTLGPGGVFQGLRNIPVLLGVCRDMDEVCPPDALLLQYSNPMAINCWAIAEGSGRPCVGLCHSVQGTARMLAHWIGAPYEEVTYKVAGINHQAWFLEFRWKGRDAYPLLRERIKDPAIAGSEPVRTDLMKYFGYFVTESSGHASEYLPYFRKSEKQVEEELVPRFTSEHDHWFGHGRTGGYLRHVTALLDTYTEEVEAQIAGKKPLPPPTVSDEYGARIIRAVECHTPIVVNGNVPNRGLITNLPQGCCVEVPCLVDGNGVQPCVVGELPPPLAAVNRTNINVQELAVRGALRGDKELIRQAIALDPLTAAVCTLPQIWAMVDELFAAQAPWLPQFASA